MTIRERDADGLILPVKGLVTVELADAHTGRVQHREQVDNFLSLQSIKVAKWWQRMMWGAFNPVETNDAAGNKPTEMPWFPAQHLAYWNDAAAESSGTEDRVAKDLVGWASRHPVGSPSGKRGVVNTSESEFKDAYSKWVFDWATSQGNGTFQSVGWTRVDETSGFPVARYPEDDGVTFTNAGTSSSSLGNALWWDSTSSLWNLAEYVSATTQFRIASAPAAGGTTTSIVLLPNTTWNNNNYLTGIARLGTDIIGCGRQASPFYPRLARHVVAGTQTWVRNETTAALNSYYNDCTIDGSSNIWTVSSDGFMRRHSSADGTITASVTPAAGPTALEGIAYDAADGNYWLCGTVNGVDKQAWKVDGSGNSVGPFYSLRQSALQVTSTVPYAGVYQVPLASARDPYILEPWESNTTLRVGEYITRGPTRSAASSTAWTLSTYAANLVVKSGEPWIAGRTATGTEVGGAGHASPIRGGTLGTRSKLASPVTKTNSQTLKVTYQFNFS